MTIMNVKTTAFLFFLALCVLCLPVRAQSQPQPQQAGSQGALPPCAVPKPPTPLDRAKRHIWGTLIRQAGVVDTRIGKASNGKVDIGAQDTTIGVAIGANTPKPCTPAPPATKPPAAPAAQPQAVAPVCVTVPGPPGQAPVMICGTPTQPAANGQSK